MILILIAQTDNISPGGIHDLYGRHSNLMGNETIESFLVEHPNANYWQESCPPVVCRGREMNITIASPEKDGYAYILILTIKNAFTESEYISGHELKKELLES